MKVYELTYNMFLLNDIQSEYSLNEISSLLDKCIFDNEATIDDTYKDFHYQNTYKYYNYSSFYPVEDNKIYKSNKIYAVKIRTIDKNLANLFNEKLMLYNTKNIKCLNGNIRLLKYFPIEKIYSITPAVIKSNDGYIRNDITIDEYENTIKINLIKKYNKYYNEKLNEDFIFCNNIKFLNNKPIKVPYKDIGLLCDKVELIIDKNSLAQKLATLSLGTGILENNARGFGYVNAKFIK